MNRNWFGMNAPQPSSIFLPSLKPQRKRKNCLNIPMQVNMDHPLAHGMFGSGEMHLKKKIYKDTIRILNQFSDKPISISQNRHIKISGSLKGEPWVFTLPTSPSGDYLERSLRSQIRRFKRQYN
jgi:hypothetical protein